MLRSALATAALRPRASAPAALLHRALATTAAEAPVEPRTKLHLPNFQMTLMYAPDLPPNEACLRVPQHATKLDIAQLLTKLYNVELVDVRTQNVLGFKRELPGVGRTVREAKYKKAYITLKEGSELKWPHPPALEELAKIRLPERRRIDNVGKGSMKKMFAPVNKLAARAKQAEEAAKKARVH